MKIYLLKWKYKTQIKVAGLKKPSAVFLLMEKNHFTVYAWDRERRLKAGKMLRWSILSESPSSCAAKGGKSIPTIDNLLVLAHLFEKSVEEIVIQRMIEVEVSCVSNKIENLCNKNCNDCKLRLSA